MEDIILDEMIKLFKGEVALLKNLMASSDYDFDPTIYGFNPVESKWNAIQRCLGATDLALALCAGNKHEYIRDLFEVAKIEIEKIVM